MFWTLKNPDQSGIFTIAQGSRIKLLAIRYIHSYKLSGSEKKLNEYINKNYSCSLKEICQKIIFNGKINMASNNEILFFINDKKSDIIARTITFGGNQCHGSPILSDAIKWAGGLVYGS